MTDTIEGLREEVQRLRRALAESQPWFLVKPSPGCVALVGAPADAPRIEVNSSLFTRVISSMQITRDGAKAYLQFSFADLCFFGGVRGAGRGYLHPLPAGWRSEDLPQLMREALLAVPHVWANHTPWNEHEVGEALHVNGELPFNPHASDPT